MRLHRLGFALVLGALLWGGLAACGGGQGPLGTPTPGVSPLPVALEAALDDPGAWEHYPARQPLVVRFNQPMDLRSALFPLQFEPAVEGQWRWNAAGTELTFLPDRGFVPGTRYRIAVDPELASADGKTFAVPPEWTLRVARIPTVMKCQLENTGAACAELAVLPVRRPVFRITFSQEMDTAAVRAALRVSPTIALTTAVDGRVLWITTTDFLKPDVVYRFTLEATAADSQGEPLSRPYAWGIQAPLPEVRAEWPARPELHDTVILQFDQAMNPDTVRQRWELSPDLPGELTWNAAGTVFSFTMAAPVTPGMPLTLSFRGPLRDAGRAMVPAPGPFALNAPPLILGIAPESVPTNTVAVFFDRPLDSKAVEAAFAITPTLAGEFAWQGNTLNFNLEEGCLQAETQYTLTFAAPLSDTEGRVWLAAPYTRTLAIGSTEPGVLLGAGLIPGAHVETIGTAGRRGVPFMIHPDNDPLAECLSAAVYQLTAEQFVERYRASLGLLTRTVTVPWGTADLSLVRSWPVTVKSNAAGALQELRVPTRVPAGLYLLRFDEAGQAREPVFLVLSQRTLMVKQAGTQVLAWLTEIGGGPVADVPVRVYDVDGRPAAEGRTDAQGLFLGTVSVEKPLLLVLAGEKANFAVSGLGTEWEDPENPYRDWRTPAPSTRKFPAYLYTDRPIYTPGQTVAFKGIVWVDGEPALARMPEGGPVVVRFRDSTEQVVETQTLPVGNFGTVTGTFELKSDAAPGAYAVELLINGEVHRRDFRVTAPPASDSLVRVIPERERLAVGELLTITVAGYDGKGKPLADAPVTLTLFTRGQDGPDWDPVPYWAESRPLLAQGRTDAAGYFTVTLPVTMTWEGRREDARSSRGSEVWGIAAVVDAGRSATLSHFAAVQVFNAAEAVRVDPGGMIREPAVAFTPTLEVRDLAGAPVANRMLNATLRALDPDTMKFDRIVTEARVKTGPDGRAEFPVMIERPGRYMLKAEGADALGNSIRYAESLFVIGGDMATWSNGRIPLELGIDREIYAPGDAARLVVTSDFSGTALLTAERSGMRQMTVITLTPPATLVSIPAQAGDMSTMYVTVHAWKANEFDPRDPESLTRPEISLLQSSAWLGAPVPGRELTLAVVPDQPDYEAGSPATLTVRVVDAQGMPVQAEFSLGLADETLYALSGAVEEPVFAAFYRERINRVRTCDSMAPRRLEIPGSREGESPLSGPILPGGISTDGVWFPTLHTDAGGAATVGLTLPDRPGRWRVTVRATTPASQVGEAVVAVVTR